MPAQLPFLTLNISDIPDWTVAYEPVNGVHIVKDQKTNKPVLAIHADDTATLVMALPKLLKFLALFGLNHPCRIPIDNMLAQANLKLIRRGEEDLGTEPKPVAD